MKSDTGFYIKSCEVNLIWIKSIQYNP